MLDAGVGGLRLAAFEAALLHRGLRHGGIFPADRDFYRRFTSRYVDEVRALDCLGLMPVTWGAAAPIVRSHGLEADLIDFLDQEPDRSAPADDGRCYLPHFEGRRLLLVSPFAELLRQRATTATFEAVWAKTGKRWPAPAAVDALELPYGFDPATQRDHGTALGLLESLTSQMAARSTTWR